MSELPVNDELESGDPAEPKEASREDALLWLTGRLGKLVHAAVVVDIGDVSVTVLASQGELQPWRHESIPGATRAHPREDITGLFTVGSADLDLTTTGVSIWIRDETDTLHVGLADNVSLEIVEQTSGEPDG